MQDMALRPEGLLFESSEADAVTTALRADHGGYSAELRQAFHHERISHRTKTDGSVTAENPHLAVLLTGTHGQLPALLTKGTEDGLFSRFLLYSLTSDVEWIDPFDTEHVDVAEEAEAFGIHTLRLYESLMGRPEPLEFDRGGFATVSEAFRRHFEISHGPYREGDWYKAVVLRGCIHATRLAMTLTCIREGIPEDWRTTAPSSPRLALQREQIMPHMYDVIVAQKIVSEVCLRHSIAIGRRILGKDVAESELLRLGARDDQVTLWKTLPDKFSAEKFATICQELGVNQRTGRGWRKKWVENELLKEQAYANYRKVSDDAE